MHCTNLICYILQIMKGEEMDVEIIFDDPAGNSYVQVNTLPVSFLCFISTFHRKRPCRVGRVEFFTVP